MDCPCCNSTQVSKLCKSTNLGYKQYRCLDCRKQFNERTSTPFNFIHYRTEVVLLVLWHYYRYKLSLDDVTELMATRGIFLSHQTVHNWVQWFGPEIGLQIRSLRRNRNGKKWHVDSTEIKVSGRVCYLYRCFDKEGNLVDVMLSDDKTKETAEAFFYQCYDTADFIPDMITTDNEAAFEHGILEVFGNNVVHRKSKYMNNRLEQDHRAPKLRYRAMKGFKDEFAALSMTHCFEEIRQLFRMKGLTRSEKRRTIMSKFTNLCNLAIITN